MKRYSLSIGNFATYEEAMDFFDSMISDRAKCWKPGQPLVNPAECDKPDYIEEFEADENFCKVE